MNAVLEIDGGLIDVADARVAIVGPPGVGKTAVVLELLARGGRAAAFERCRLSVSGEIDRQGDNLRLRARHLPRLRGIDADLSVAQRAWLRTGHALSRLPIVGSRIGRRCFVDLDPEALVTTTEARPLTHAVVLTTDNSTRSSVIEDWITGPTDGVVVTTMDVDVHDPAELADRLVSLVVDRSHP